jgi:hypothetical protein
MQKIRNSKKTIMTAPQIIRFATDSFRGMGFDVVPNYMGQNAIGIRYSPTHFFRIYQDQLSAHHLTLMHDASKMSISIFVYEVPPYETMEKLLNVCRRISAKDLY